VEKLTKLKEKREIPPGFEWDGEDGKEGFLVATCRTHVEKKGRGGVSIKQARKERGL